MIYIIWALTRDVARVRFAGALAFCSYAIAPNALNVLVGKGWQEIIWIAKENFLAIHILDTDLMQQVGSFVEWLSRNSVVTT